MFRSVTYVICVLRFWADAVEAVSSIAVMNTASKWERNGDTRPLLPENAWEGELLYIITELYVFTVFDCQESLHRNCD